MCGVRSGLPSLLLTIDERTTSFFFLRDASLLSPSCTYTIVGDCCEGSPSSRISSGHSPSDLLRTGASTSIYERSSPLYQMLIRGFEALRPAVTGT